MKNVVFRLMVGCENLQLAVTAGGPSALARCPARCFAASLPRLVREAPSHFALEELSAQRLHNLPQVPPTSGSAGM